MKYPEGKMSLDASLPTSLQSWFGHELESRGIDAVIYTRYIISLLQQDQVELDPVEVDADHLWGRRLDLKKIRGRKHEKKKHMSITEEEKKKSAAVECLLSISDMSDEATDLEGLVEELIIRLKEIHAHKENQEPQKDLSNQGSCHESSVLSASTPEDPAERYYAAFPALQGQCGIVQVSPTSQCDTGVWRKNNPMTNQLADASDELPDDANENCGLGRSTEVKINRSKPLKVLASKSAHDNATDQKKSSGKGRFNNMNNTKMTKPNQGKHGKSKRENKGFNRAARFLSWPQGNHGRQENERNRKNFCSDVPSGKAKSVSPTKLENRRNEKNFSGRDLSSSFSNNQDYYRSQRQWRRECGLSPVSPEFKEQESWYTQPLDGILSSTPDTKGRLFNRHNLSTSDQYSSGTPSPSQSSPADSPNITGEIHFEHQITQLREDVWHVFEDDLQPQAESVPDHLKLPAFFLVADTPADSPYKGSEAGEWSSLEQENLRFENPEDDHLALLMEGSIALMDNANCDTFDGQKQLLGTSMIGDIVEQNSTTSECHAPCRGQLFDLVPPSHSGEGRESLEALNIFPIDLVLDEPCSQNSPSQYNAWGSLPLDIAESSLELSFPLSEYLSPMKPVEIDCLQLLPSFDDQFLCTEDPDGSIQNNLGAESCNTTENDALFYMGKDFSCFLSEESLSLFGDLIAKSRELTEPADVWKPTDDFWPYAEPKKAGVFSAALFSDLLPSLIKEDVFNLGNPLYEDYYSEEATVQAVWESYQLNCKHSPLASAWLGPTVSDTCEEYPLEDAHLQKVWDSQLFNYKPSPSSTWLGTAVSDSSLSYIPLFSLWVEEEPASTVDDSEEENQLTEPKLLELNPLGRLEEPGDLWKHAKSVSLENITSMLWEFTGLERSTKLSKSFELVPSEHSAFEDVVPKKLLHVHSEPNLKYSQTSPSMLRTPVPGDLGFRDGCPKESQEHLYFSPKTHFRPIQTPDEHSRAVTPDDLQELNLQDLFGGHLATSKTPYQPYVADENVEASFIPRFRVKKASAKYVQTGHGVGEISSDEEEVPVEQTLEMEDDKLGVVFEVLAYSDDSSEEGLVVGDLSNLTLCESKLFKSNKPNVSGGEDGLEEWNLRSLWSTSSDLDTVLTKDPQSACSSPYTAYGSSIWSTGGDANIPPLPPLGTYDSEQSFYWTTSETPSDYENSFVCEAYAKDTKEESEASPAYFTMSVSPNLTAPDEGCFKLQSHLLNWNELAPLPDQAVYSCELEQKWLNSDTDTPSQLAMKDTKIKRISRKPCSFFLEGHCRRTDCKFAHDMSRITCRFWEDGECFKGTTCPFLHGYPSDDNDSESSTSRKGSYEWNHGDFPEFGEQKSDPEKIVKKTGISKSTKKKNVLMKKAWSTYRNSRWASKEKKETVERTEKETILRKN